MERETFEGDQAGFTFNCNTKSNGSKKLCFDVRFHLLVDFLLNVKF